MRLTENQIIVINQYTDPYRIDRDKLIAYLEKHRTIKSDVFGYCTKVSKRGLGSRGFCMFLDKEPAFTPVDRETFIRRIPFYFYQVQMGGDKRSGLSKIIPIERKPALTQDDFNAFYTDLEWMFYDLRLSLDDIFGYVGDQLFASVRKEDSGKYGLFTTSFLEEKGLQTRDVFFWWRHYLHMCQELGWQDYMPNNFITSYNLALEATGKEPIIYRPLKDYISYFKRDNNAYICRGNFPCDRNGTPIMKWTTIRVSNPASIEFSGDKSRCGELRINLAPKTTIHVREFYEEVDDEEIEECANEDEPLMWRQIYAGPQTMYFNHEALREFRLERKMTQSEVAYAIDTSVRTYQKWEGGETTPDGHNLLRLMCWLNIDDVQTLIKYEDYPDTTK